MLSLEVYFRMVRILLKKCASENTTSPSPSYPFIPFPNFLHMVLVILGVDVLWLFRADL